MMNPHNSINNLLLRPLNLSYPFRNQNQNQNQSLLLLPHKFNYRFHYVKCCDYHRVRYQSSMKTANEVSDKPEYKPGIFDHLLLTLFRNKMVEEVGWDSDKPGYDGLIEVANRLMMKAPNNAETAEASVRILKSLFPPFLLELFKMLVAPLGRGKLAAIMVARVTALSCQWLMGTCKVNSVDLPDGSTWKTGVLVEKCKYLEESKCVGICINTCKLPTQTFINDYMGVPLVMEPDFSNYSCQFKFGVLPPINAEDKTLSEPCLAICPTASRRRELKTTNEMQCPKL